MPDPISWSNPRHPGLAWILENTETVTAGDGAFVSCSDPTCERWAESTIPFQHFHPSAA